ncbi:MAG: EamA family transporter [Candidatus Undinarchaeales archaeon]|jgi:transporter family protein|nr:EamA family transporter [Candidatus Undinarchaeales archaeon]
MPAWFTFALITLLLWGLWGIFPKLATNHIDPRSVLVFEGIGRFVVTLVVLAMIGFRPEMKVEGVSYAVLGGLIGSIGAVFFFYAVSQGKASVVVTTTALYPLITILVSYPLLGEEPSARQGLGMVFAMIALVLFSVEA